MPSIAKLWERGPGFRVVSRTQGTKTQRELDLGHTTTTTGEQQRKSRLKQRDKKIVHISFSTRTTIISECMCCIFLWRSSSPPRPCRCQPGSPQLGARRRATWPTYPWRGTTLDGTFVARKQDMTGAQAAQFRPISCWAARTKCNNRGQP